MVKTGLTVVIFMVAISQIYVLVLLLAQTNLPFADLANRNFFHFLKSSCNTVAHLSAQSRRTFHIVFVSHKSVRSWVSGLLSESALKHNGDSEPSVVVYGHGLGGLHCYLSLHLLIGSFFASFFFVEDHTLCSFKTHMLKLFTNNLKVLIIQESKVYLFVNLFTCSKSIFIYLKTVNFDIFDFD